MKISSFNEKSLKSCLTDVLTVLDILSYVRIVYSGLDKFTFSLYEVPGLNSENSCRRSLKRPRNKQLDILSKSNLNKQNLFIFESINFIS